MKDEVDFLHPDKHESFLQIYKLVNVENVKRR